MMMAVRDFEKRFLTGNPTAIALNLVMRIFHNCRLVLRSRIRQTLGCFDLSRRASMLPSIAALDRSTKNMAEN